MDDGRDFGLAQRIQTGVHLEGHVEPRGVVLLARLELVTDRTVDDQRGRCDARRGLLTRVERHLGDTVDQALRPLGVPGRQRMDRLPEQVLSADDLRMRALVQKAPGLARQCRELLAQAVARVECRQEWVGHRATLATRLCLLLAVAQLMIHVASATGTS